jgi:hypothetical protein
MAERHLFAGEEHATATSQPYWDGLHAGELVLQRCEDCGRFQHYPRRLCRWCGAATVGWAPTGGVGTVFVSTVAHRLRNDALNARCPLTLALVRLDEGPMVMALAETDRPGAQLRGTRVRVDHPATTANRVLTVRDHFGPPTDTSPPTTERSEGLLPA